MGKQRDDDVDTTNPHRVFNFAALASGILLTFTIALWLAAFVANPWDHHLSVTRSLHIGVWGGSDGPTFGCLVFFNDEEYGPYRGSIIARVDEQGNPHPRYRVRAWGDSFGVYYRHFYFPDSDHTLWTLMISLLYPLAVLAILPLAWGWFRSAQDFIAAQQAAAAERVAAW